jgi:hypothetical protein
MQRRILNGVFIRVHSWFSLGTVGSLNGVFIRVHSRPFVVFYPNSWFPKTETIYSSLFASVRGFYRDSRFPGLKFVLTLSANNSV